MFTIPCWPFFVFVLPLDVGFERGAVVVNGRAEPGQDGNNAISETRPKNGSQPENTLSNGLVDRRKIGGFFLRDLPTVSYRNWRARMVRWEITGARLCLRCRKHCNLLSLRFVDKPPEKVPLPAPALLNQSLTDYPNASLTARGEIPKQKASAQRRVHNMMFTVCLKAYPDTNRTFTTGC